MSIHHTIFNLKPLTFAIATVLLTGCGGGSSTPPPTTKTTNVQMSGAVVDGYLVNSIVCLDLSLDGYCQLATEPATTTASNGQYSFTVTPTQQAHANFKTAPIMVVDGYDSDTGKRYAGKLFAPQSLAKTATTETTSSIDNSISLNVTALTTLVEKTGDATKVKQALGLEGSIDLNADPIQLATSATTDTEKAIAKTVLAQNIAINRAIETLTNAATGDSTTNTETLYSALNSVIDAQVSDTTKDANSAVGLWVQRLTTATTTVPGSTAITAAKVVADKTNEVITTLTTFSSATIQTAALQSSAVVTAVAGITDATQAINLANTAVQQSAQRTYLINQDIDLTGVSAGDITTFDGLTIDFLGQTTLTALTTIKDTAGVPTSIQTLIQTKLDELAKLAAADAVISALKSLGMTLTPEDETTLKTLDATSLNGVYSLTNLASISGLPTAIKTELDRQIAAETIIKTLADYEINLTETQITAIKAINPIQLNGDYSLSNLLTLSGLPTEVASSILTKIDEQTASTQLNAIAGDYWQTNSYLSLEGSTTTGNSAIWFGNSLEPNKLTITLTDSSLSANLTENGSITLGQDLRYTNNPADLIHIRSVEASNTTSGIPIFLNADHTLTLPNIAVNQGQTGTENINGSDKHYTITYAKDNGIIPFYKDSVSNRYAYAYMRTHTKQFGADADNWTMIDTSLSFIIPKTNTDTGVLPNVGNSTYGGIILQSQFPSALGTQLSSSAKIVNFVVETSRWTVGTDGNINRPASSQNVAKLTNIAGITNLIYNGEDFPTSTRIDRTATTTENSNAGGTLTTIWGEGDNSTRKVAYTPDGMFMVLNKHHTSFDETHPSPVYDCANTAQVPDNDMNKCQLGTRVAVKLPASGTNADIVNALNGKTYRFLVQQIQGNTQGDLIELFSGPVEATFGKSGANLTLAIVKLNATTSTLRYSGNPGQITQIGASDSVLDSVSPPIISFVETSDSMSEANNRLGEFEIAQTGNDSQSNIPNGDPANSSNPGTHIRFFTSQDGADADSAPDLIIGAVYSEDSNDSTDTQRDKSVWLLMGTPATLNEPVIIVD